MLITSVLPRSAKG